MANTNGGPQDSAAVPSVGVLTQYIKDLSFENPNAPQKGISQQPEVTVEFNVNAKSLSDTEVEVTLKIEASAKTPEQVLFALELVYAGVFRIVNLDPEPRQQIILIECPRLLFPFARQIVAEVTNSGGFPPLLIDPVDFVSLYRQRLMQQQAAAGKADTQ